MEFYNIINEEYMNALKFNVIYPKFKIEIMDHYENVLDEITQDISAEDNGSISINYQQGVRRSCSVTLINTDKKFNPNQNGKIWINTKFKLYLGLKIKKTGDIYWFSQGIFVLTNPSVLRDMSKKTITLNGVDKFGLFGSETNFNETEGTYLVPYNTKVKNIIEDILLLDMGNGYKTDIKKPLIDFDIGEQRIPYEIKKAPNSYISEILIELGNMFACDVFYDTNGVLNFTKGNENVGMDHYSSIWDYSDVFSEYYSPTLNLDFPSVYNTVKVVGNNPNDQIYEYTAVNDDFRSPTRVQLIGQKVKYIESSFCYNLDRTRDFANYLLRKYAIVQSPLDFQSSFIPHLDVNCIVNISDKYLDYINQRFIIQSLTMPFTSKSLIGVSASNTANIPYFEF